MKPLHLLAMSVAMAALAIFAAAEAGAQQRPVGGGARITISSQSNSSLRTDMSPACRHGCFSWERGHHRFRGGFPVFVVEREVPVIVEVPAPPPPVANSGTPNRDVPELPRKPYVIGSTYASLPGGCMKMIEEGVSFYYCSGQWYRQSGWGRGSKYVAVAKP